MMCIPQSFSSTLFYRSDFISIDSIDGLAFQLNFCNQERFTGQIALSIQMKSAQQWSLFFEKGCLVWGSGGTHPVRRWYRYLSHYQSSNSKLVLSEHHEFESWAYEILGNLLEQHVIQPHTVEQIIQHVLIELLFDLLQQWSQSGYKSRLHIYFKHVLPDPNYSGLATLPVNPVWQNAKYDWETWQHNGLEQYSPEQAPLIWDAKRLQQQVLSKTYQNLSSLMDGQRTLRDLATKTNKPFTVVAKSLLPLIQQGLINLQEVSDLAPPTSLLTNLTTPSFASSARKSTLPESKSLIAYIDDQTDDGQLMGQILSHMGYRFIHISDSMQALPILLEAKPSLIFLDLVMPVINGYEACTQIRRISKLKDIPVIILTSNDGVIDRVRAKIVGATGFLSKPIEAKKIQAILQKMLPTLASRADC